MLVKVRAEIIIDIDINEIDNDAFNLINQNLYDILYLGAEDSEYKDLKIRTIHEVKENV